MRAKMTDSLIDLSELKNTNPYGDNIPQVEWSEILSNQLGNASWALDVAPNQRRILSDPERPLAEREKAGEALRAIRGIHAIQDQTWLFVAKEVQKLEKYGATKEEGIYLRGLIEKIGELYFLFIVKLIAEKDFHEWLEKLKEPLREIEDHIKDRQKIIQFMEEQVKEIKSRLKNQELLKKAFSAFMDEIKDASISSLSIPNIGLSSLDNNLFLLYEESKTNVTNFSKGLGKVVESESKIKMRYRVQEADKLIRANLVFGSDVPVNKVTQLYQYMLDFINTTTVEEDSEFQNEINELILVWEKKMRKELSKFQWPSVFKAKERVSK
ncbi:hypothetical protein KJ997_00100 [bacterium]|nr:hypothetical protein [bacterium]